MRVPFGIEASSVRKETQVEVFWDDKMAVNGHILMMGMSGSGKTHNLRKILGHMQKTAPAGRPFRVHVFDIHGDIDLPGASTVLFSEQTEYGLNPLAINPDPHFGGVRKRVQTVIKTLNKTSRKLGDKQEACLRNVMHELYEQFGFDPSNPDTWSIAADAPAEPTVIDGRLFLDVPFDEKEEAKSHGAQWHGQQWPGAPRNCWWIMAEQYKGPITMWRPKMEQRRYPTMTDLQWLANKILRSAYFGTNHEAVITLESYRKASLAYRNKVLAATRKGDKLVDDDKLQADLEKAAGRAKEAYSEYVDSLKGGKEIEELLRYDSVDVLKSTVERLENLLAVGIFKSKTPPFDPQAHLWRYNIRPLGKDEQKLFVLFKLEELFQMAVQRGETDYIQDVLVVDEASNFFDDDESNILNTIALEARKFGVSLICASQAPTHFSDDFVSSVGTKIVLGIDEMFWTASCRKLNLDLEALKWIRPRQSMLVQIKQGGATQNNWRWVYTNPVRSTVPANS